MRQQWVAYFLKTILIILIIFGVLIVEPKAQVSGRSPTTEQQPRTLNDFWAVSYIQSQLLTGGKWNPKPR